MDRHLLPDEIDLLVDAESGLETGFGVAPLRAHVRACAACRAELESARELATTLAAMPHFAPPVGFADRVMAEVHVFEPWHVALADTVRGLVPESRPLRAAAAVATLAAGGLFTAVLVWVLARADVLAFTTDVAAVRARAALWGAFREAIVTLAGAYGASSTGTTFVLALTALVVALALATTGLRAAATASRRAGEHHGPRRGS